MMWFVLLLGGISLKAQDTIPDNRQIVMGSTQADTISTDSNKVIEDAPLDIGQDRGLFILTRDRRLQLRILGSVRFLAVYDNRDLSSKNSYSTFEIPTGDQNRSLPNFFNGVGQSRLGFEVTRSTRQGNIFVRLETDFAGANNAFRIRHAYGQISRFLLGQTWSLFSHIAALPATVDFGSTASITVRTPQVRYSLPAFFSKVDMAVAFEYSIPSVDLPDSLLVQTFQLIPDITFRVDRITPWGSWQLSGLLPVLSGRTSDGTLVLRPGWGISASAVLNSWAAGKWYFLGGTGRAISRYFGDLGGRGLDLAYNPETEDTRLPLVFGGYGTYEHSWRYNLTTSLTYGVIVLERIGFTPENTYHWGYSLHFNTFWTVVEGAKLGAEAIWGQRFDRVATRGDALRLNILAYYDF